MLNSSIRSRLENIKDLPTIPFVMNEILHSVDNENVRASQLASLIERDQALTARVLRVANSPFYGFTRKISTIELAIVLLGLNTIKEIVLSLVLQKFYNKLRRSVINTKDFWSYSVFCGACSRFLARKTQYRLAGEAFVAGLMHDIGILIMSEHFAQEFLMVKIATVKHKMSMLEAERAILSCTHAEIGAWFAEKWNLPQSLYNAIRYHHSSYEQVKANLEKMKILQEITKKRKLKIENISTDPDQPVTRIVALAEWFAVELGYRNWIDEPHESYLYEADTLLDELCEREVLNPSSVIKVYKDEIMEEYKKASVFSQMATTSLYK
ncbi:MAG: putative signal transduction protein [Ignavibacteria bacterium]|nr:putative signal transduction protein [Ignavibacteria bacterium]